MTIPIEIRKILAKLEPNARKAFYESIRAIRSSTKLNEVIAYLAAGNVEAAVASLNIDKSLLSSLEQAVAEAFWQGGAQALAGLATVANPLDGNRLILGFQGRHVRAEAWLADKSSTLIQGITDSLLTSSRDFMRSALEAGIAPRSIALELVGRIDSVTGRRVGGILGLTEQFTQYTMTAREELLSGNAAKLRNYLTRARRDKRFDVIVKASIKTGKPIMATKVNDMIASYNDRLLLLRGQTIARNEMLNSMRAGRREGYQQLIDSGKVRDDQIERKWSANIDARVREDHQEMNGKKIKGLTTSWDLPDGSKVMYPGDRSLGAPGNQTIQCRCYEEFRIAFIKDKTAASVVPTPAPVDTSKFVLPVKSWSDKFSDKEKKNLNSSQLENLEKLTSSISEEDLLSSLLGDEDYRDKSITLSQGHILVQGFGSKSVYEVSREIVLKDLSVIHSLLRINDDYQGKSVAKNLLQNSVNAYKHIGIKRIDVHANIEVGGYAWSKYGFKPNSKSWRNFLGDSLDSSRSDEWWDIPYDDRASVLKLLDSKDPKAIWAISDSKYGKQLLLKSNWFGELDLTDKESMDRFNAYVRK